jgi:hypothetical protein
MMELLEGEEGTLLEKVGHWARVLGGDCILHWLLPAYLFSAF